MRKLVAILAALAVLTTGTAGGCKDKPKKCEAGEVREDSFNPGKYWQCNQDGTEEYPLEAPGDHAPDPIEG